MKISYYIHGAIWDRYYTLGGPNAKTDIEFELGPPISDIGPYVHTLPPEVSSHGTHFRYQNFEGGALDYNVDNGEVFEIHGTIFAKWRGLGYAAGDLGLVTSDEREAAISAIGTEGRVSDFEGGHIHWHRNGPFANKAFETHGAIDVVYCSEGGSGGWLGFPVSDEYVNPSGYAQSDFEGGYITTTDGVNYEAFGKEDTTPPTLTIVRPIYLHDNMIDLTGTAYDVSGILNNEVLIMVDSEEFDVCRHFFAPYNSITGWWRLTDIPIGYGNNEITVYAQDTNHNVAEETTSVYLAHPDFSFVHLTDAHIKDDLVMFSKWGILYPLSLAKFNSDIYEINHLDPKPDFILDTGDIADYANEDFYQSYLEALESLNDPIKVYTVPGNHDRRNILQLTDPILLAFYNTIIKRPDGCLDLIPPNNYTFEHKGYLFIGLDSGEDYNHINLLLQYDLTPESDGLSNEQLTILKNPFIIDPAAPKIIFMHHPAINTRNDYFPLNPVPPNGPGGNDACIANNRWDFINYCYHNNVQLVLTGHTHEDHVFGATGVELEYKIGGDSYPRPLFIQTPSATDDTKKFEHGYRIIDIKDGKALPYPYTITKTPPMVSGSAACPITLHAYDSQRRHTGINLTGESERNIPDSFYFSGYEIEANETLNITANQTIPETIFLYNTSDKYRFEIVANLTEEEKQSPMIDFFNFTVEQQTDDTRTIITYHNVPLTENTTATLPINLTTTAYTMEIDHNGDGTTDETKDPDLIEINYAPTAAIIAPETGSIYNESEPVMFNGTGRDPEDGILTNFSLVWYSDINGIIGCGERFSTANLSAGAHTISLMVNDSVDLRDTDSVMVTVVGSTPIPPIANFTYSPENPVFDQPITFNASSSYDQDGFITNYEWDFGDGNITNTTEEMILHSYPSARDYTVNLTVTDDDGAPNSTLHLINVISPIGGFSVALLPKLNSANAGEACDFTVRLRNTQNFDEYVVFDLTLSGIPAEYAANLTWFNWTTSTLSIPTGEYRDIGLRMDIPEGFSGYKSFGIVAHGTFGDSKDYGVVNVTLAP